jgi:hypothetical protein
MLVAIIRKTMLNTKPVSIGGKLNSFTTSGIATLREKRNIAKAMYEIRIATILKFNMVMIIRYLNA